ncbi:hypothetical protein DFJ73DRAFT_584091 [Zopfochytrium polystomum]|nr:hypothetical protein DFJ73DRAFT_584091 [Zopfochytrium polystomum]
MGAPPTPSMGPAVAAAVAEFAADWDRSFSSTPRRCSSSREDGGVATMFAASNSERPMPHIMWTPSPSPETILKCYTPIPEQTPTSKTRTRQNVSAHPLRSDFVPLVPHSSSDSFSFESAAVEKPIALFPQTTPVKPKARRADSMNCVLSTPETPPLRRYASADSSSSATSRSLDSRDERDSSPSPPSRSGRGMLGDDLGGSAFTPVRKKRKSDGGDLPATPITPVRVSSLHESSDTIGKGRRPGSSWSLGSSTADRYRTDTPTPTSRTQSPAERPQRSEPKTPGKIRSTEIKSFIVVEAADLLRRQISIEAEAAKRAADAEGQANQMAEQLKERRKSKSRKGAPRVAEIATRKVSMATCSTQTTPTRETFSVTDVQVAAVSTGSTSEEALADADVRNDDREGPKEWPTSGLTGTMFGLNEFGSTSRVLFDSSAFESQAFLAFGGVGLPSSSQLSDERASDVSVLHAAALEELTLSSAAAAAVAVASASAILRQSSFASDHNDYLTMHHSVEVAEQAPKVYSPLAASSMFIDERSWEDFINEDPLDPTLWNAAPAADSPTTAFVGFDERSDEEPCKRSKKGENGGLGSPRIAVNASMDSPVSSMDGPSTLTGSSDTDVSISTSSTLAVRLDVLGVFDGFGLNVEQDFGDNLPSSAASPQAPQQPSETSLTLSDVPRTNPNPVASVSQVETEPDTPASGAVFTCSIQYCGKSYKRESGLRNHMAVQHTDRAKSSRVRRK